MIVWPSVAGKLVEVLPTLPGWGGVSVYDGPLPQGDSPTVYATVGIATDENVGTFSSTQASDGFQREEQGTVISLLAVQSGYTDIPGNRAAVFALLDTLDDWLRANRTLGGVLSADGTSDLSADVQSISNVNGTAQALVFTVNYYTVT